MDYEIRGLIWQEWIKNLDNFVSIFNLLISINNISSILESPLREFWGEKASTGLTITVLACNRIPGTRYSPSPSSFPRRTWTSCYTLGLRVNLVSVRIIVSRLDDCYGMVTRQDVSPFVVVKKGYKLIHGIWVALIEVGVPPLLFLFASEYSNFLFKTLNSYLIFVFVSIFPGIIFSIDFRLVYKYICSVRCSFYKFLWKIDKLEGNFK